MPQLHKELNNYSIHLSLADECNNAFNKLSTKIKQICEAEQNLALDVDQNGEKIKDPTRIIISLLTDNDVKIEDKLRLVMLFLLNKNGISENSLLKLISHSGMPESLKQVILNLKLLGMKVLIDENNVSNSMSVNINYYSNFTSQYLSIKIFLKIDENVKNPLFSSRGGLH